MISELLEEGRRDGVFTHASVCVVRDGAVLLEAGDPRTFDIASVTKVVTSVLAHRHLSIDRKVAWIQGNPTIGELLSHSSGLPAWRPLFAHAATALGVSTAELVRRGDLQARAKEIYRDVIAATRCDAPRPTYSDLGFLALGFELEREGVPLLLTGFARAPPLDRIETGRGRPRAGNPKVEETLVAQASPGPLAVDDACDDDNAAAIGGTCGHAGLWAKARDVAMLGDEIRRDRALAPMFTRVAGSRTYGLDTPSGEAPSIGSMLGRGPLGAAGHLGFTGCSLWIDRDARVSIAFLSNAVSVERPNPRLRTFRPTLHDALARELRLA